MGGQRLLAEHVLPDITDSQADALVLTRETYLRNVIASARNLRGLAERYTEDGISRAVIQTTPAWKSELARDAILLDSEGFDFMARGQAHVQSLTIFENEALRGEIFQTWMALTTGTKKKRGRVHSWSDGEKALISSRLDEAEVLMANAGFLASALGVERIEVYAVGDGEDVAGKARHSFPLDPGIAFL